MPTFLIIGAGSTGIGAAVRLTELGIDHLVVDAGPQVGGMSASVTDDAGFTWIWVDTCCTVISPISTGPWRPAGSR
ncbi:NAD(P)-binding protein [Mycolicibacterium sp. PDY-3]|uniref:NAD(P)-binding protein n=1 Tax=Mycolicibacterium sp. PDY-3 TaxID=3376069 RepID=UPI00378AF4DF